MIKYFLISFITMIAFLNNSFAQDEYNQKACDVTQKSTNEAVFHYKKSIENHPKDIQAYIALSEIRMAQGEYIKALTNLLKAKDINENDFDVNYHLAQYHFKRTNFQKSIKYYVKAQELKQGQDEELWIKMGKTYEKLADIPKAKSSYISALSLNHENIETLNSLKRLDKLVQKKEHRY